MKTNFCIRCLLLTMITAIFITLPCMRTVFASVQTIEADGYYIIGDGPDENHSVAKNRAKMDAKRSAAEKAGIFVESLTEVKNGQLTKDEINTISAQVLQIDSEKITPEVIGETIRYCCHIVAKVDSSNVMNKLKQDRQNLYKAVEQNKRQQQELAAVKNELAELKTRYKLSNEKQQREINNNISKNEDRFTAINWLEKGNDSYLLGNKQKALECYQNAVQLNPNYDAAWSSLASVNIIIGNYHEAKECYQKSIQINPDSDVSWCMLGVTYDGLGNKQKAKECYQRAIQINPNSDVSWCILGTFQISLGDYQTAKESYQKAIKINPNYDTALAMLGFTYYNLGSKQKAQECYQRSLQINSNNDTTWCSLGIIYYNSGNKQKAKECLQKALQINPNNSLVQKAIRILK